MGEDASAFALDAYLVPRHGTAPGTPGGTIPKADKDKGGLFAEVNRRAADGPGPEKYHKDILAQSFVRNLKGGKWSSKPSRQWMKMSGATPSVGQYDVSKAIDATKKRTKGCKISRNDRKCFIQPSSIIPAPGAYDPKLRDHFNSPMWSTVKTQSRIPRMSSMGPGHYNPMHALIEKKVLAYSGSKDGAKSFLDKIMANSEKSPAPGHVGIPASRWEDRAGKAMHTTRLLLDRLVKPRSADKPRSAGSKPRSAGFDGTVL